MSESCSSRHFSWLMKSCFPNPQHHTDPTPITNTTLRRQHRTITSTTTICSLPDDLLLECILRLPHSSLPSVSLVCRRWSQLLDSSSFYNLRQLHGHLRYTVFAVSVSHSGLHAASHNFGHDTSWKTASFLLDDVVSSGCFLSNLFSHSRLAAIGRKIYVIGREAMLQCDTWSGTVIPKPAMLVPRKKFAAAVVSGKIYVAGGSARSEVVEEFDPETNKWRKVADAPRRRYGCIGASVDGVFYIIGGLKIGSSINEHSSLAAGAEAHLYASSMDLYEVATRGWLRSRAVPGGGCVVAACAAVGHIYVLASHAVELSFWKFNAWRQCGGGGFGDWCRMKTPPLPARVRLDSTVRFSSVGIGDKVVLIQVTGSIDDLLRRSGRSTRGLKEKLVLVYDCGEEEWSRGVDAPEVIRRAACVCVEC